ncbi:murein DD-endopeptidase MepM/ murein hydrolase activator NlpD [Friedmanniella endophytica]|uniref:Murein DD-endopeptidase MepM/ murein hydrolase activator NlpD n=1 Tax=Microlunatus kandeliicorticis TaxID=1759536 RepID=A0A7W3P4V7_9ACTN|nr:M23 family metallopeptidase [Microlunatus kandeliicorticis]MBA8793227.1 murein DD-endopeptidase MepM/ murein hydrolase activator NlpD [Microlunatus kandeliicorticis]
MRRTLPGLTGSTQQSLARRALIEDIESDKRSWLRHGAAGLAVAALGLVVAGSVALTGTAANRAESSVPAAPAATSTGQVPSAFDARTQSTSRDASRLPLDGETVDPKAAAAAQAAAAKAQQRTGATSTGASGASTSAARQRAKVLESTQEKAAKLADKLEAEKAEAAVNASSPNASADGTTVASAAQDSGQVSLPITSGYTVAARFGQVGAWARYHTGFDFACPIGTPIHAVADGVVTNAGPNGEAGWAGNYVTIRHADGTQSLYAHMADVTVSVGQKVTGGQVIGHVGMTGRSFGPHVHFEVYPAGVTPGDVYKAVDPLPWLKALGLNP